MKKYNVKFFNKSETHLQNNSSTDHLLCFFLGDVVKMVLEEEYLF